MRELTFKGFLKNYVRELSECKSNSLTKLSKEAESKNPRLREPLLLYAFLTHNKDTSYRLLRKSGRLVSDYNEHLAKYKNLHALVQTLEKNDDSLPDSYHKVYRSYLSNKNRYQYDNHTKTLMKAKILKLQREKNVTDYRLYTDLHLNPGNFNAFMKHNDLEKLSLNNTRKVLTYLENYKNLEVMSDGL